MDRPSDVRTDAQIQEQTLIDKDRLLYTRTGPQIQGQTLRYKDRPLYIRTDPQKGYVSPYAQST